MTRAQLISAVVSAMGFVIWAGVSITAGGREAWDHPLYWQAGYPMLALVAALAGFCEPNLLRRWPLLLAASQFVAMVILNLAVTHNGASLLPLGLIAFILMSLPLYIPAWLGAVIARTLSRRIL